MGGGEGGQTDREHPTSLRDGKGEVGNRGRAVKDWEAGELERRGRGREIRSLGPRPRSRAGAHRGRCEADAEKAVENREGC